MMHEDQVEIGVPLVRRLLAEQYPRAADLPIERVQSTGTVNALFRLGGGSVARLPLVARWSEDIEREWQWLPWLSEGIGSIRIPEPVFKGEPTSWYPFPWAIYRWIDGTPYDDALVRDERRAAEALAAFVLELRALELVDHAPPAGRRPLRELDRETREAIRAADETIDAAAAMSVWDEALEASAWDGQQTWIHGDLLRPNLLVHEGRLVAVIDFGGVGVGDPATDLMPAWSVFGEEGRRAFRAALGPDTHAWRRGRGIALHQAALVIPYYPETNPRFVSLSKRAIEQILEDFTGTADR
jgi:aminoglycoside phosphotransferase (APT) family kinase protein